MKKYEYKTVSTPVLGLTMDPLSGNYLTNVYGQFGWRLVSMIVIDKHLHYTFMREEEE